MRKFILALLVVLFIPYSVSALEVCGFETFDLEDNQNFKSEEKTDFTCKDYTFAYEGKTDPEYGFYWNGFAYSTWRDTETKGYENQYSAITKNGVNNSDTYCIFYSYGENNSITIKEESNISGFYITNTTYAYYSMEEGDEMAKVFGGQSGNDKDFLKVIIKGYDSEGEKTGEKEFYLADYSFDDNSKDYIVNEWKWVDLSGLGLVKKLKFDLESTEKYTPTYFAMDNLNGAPPSSGESEDSADDSDSSSEISCFISSFSKNSVHGYFYLSAAVLSFFILISLRTKKNEE